MDRMRWIAWVNKYPEITLLPGAKRCGALAYVLV